MLEIQERYLTKNEYSRPGNPLISVKGIVIHWVANPGSSGLANRNYFESLKNQLPGDKAWNYSFGSAHFIIGLDGEIIQCLLEHELAYHVGSTYYKDSALKKLSTYPNNCTIGIELCHPVEFDDKGNKITASNLWEGKFTEKVLATARELILDLCGRYKLNRENIFRHFDITGKDCPRYFVKNQNEWEKFLDNVF